MKLAVALVALSVLALLAVALAGCGNVSLEGGRGGAGGADAAAERAAVTDAASARANDADGRPLERDAAADVGACLDTNAPGFALGATCDGGGPASKGCHASCTLDGQPFAGCVAGSPYAAACYASCSGCR